MSSITNEELSLLRDESQIWYPDLCDIYTFTPVDDGYGGHGDDTESLVASDVKCAIESGAGHEQLITLLGLERPDAIYMITLPAEEAIKIGDHIVVTSKGDLSVQVQAVLAPESYEIDRIVVTNEI